jgi:hypothetical protein
MNDNRNIRVKKFRAAAAMCRARARRSSERGHWVVMAAYWDRCADWLERPSGCMEREQDQVPGQDEGPQPQTP